MSVKDHKDHSYVLTFGVITASSTRTEDTDESGKLAIELVSKLHKLAYYKVVKDDVSMLRASILEANCDFLIVNGGTGLSKFDLTIEAIKPYFTKNIEGFGELFRMISYKEIGSAAMMSRASAGLINKKIVFVVPGSPAAITTAVTMLILPEVSHIYYELTKE
ncbi:MAG: MogA/MoaB family molybdenum cofactor biosynthesis protein [Thermoplasmata archaeon]